MRKTKDVVICYWTIQNYARFCLFFSILLIFHILYSLVIIITKASKWWSGWYAGWWSLGPGFESQVQQNNCFYFSYHIHMQAFKGVPPCTFTSQVPCGFKQQSNGHDWVITMLPVNQRPGQSRKSKGLERLMGQNCQTYPFVRPSTPWFLWSFLF